MLLAAVLLAGVSLYALAFRGGGGDAPKGSGTFAPTGNTASTSPSTAPATSQPPPSTTTSQASRPVPGPCAAAQLAITAGTSAPGYPADAQPTVAIVVTNRGPAPCVQDLSDGQIELRIYNGSARVWGSHDCAIQPGQAPATLPVGQPIRREIQWSGLSSQPACAGTRTRVGAGRYTVLAFLSGHQGTPVTFTLAG